MVDYILQKKKLLNRKEAINERELVNKHRFQAAHVRFDDRPIAEDMCNMTQSMYFPTSC